MPTRRWNSAALLTASWPVMASATYRTSVGSADAPSGPPARPSARRRCAGGPRCRRAGSRGRTERASSGPSCRIFRGSVSAFRMVHGWPVVLLTQRAQLLARGRAGRRRWTRAAGDGPPCTSHRASLAVRGGLARALQARHQHDRGQPGATRRQPRRLPPPSSATISSRTTRSTAWSGVRLFRTSWPTARTRTRSRNSFTTLKWTSASSRARLDLAQRLRRRRSGVSAPRPAKGPEHRPAVDRSARRTRQFS